jgi:hypothetical protein
VPPADEVEIAVAWLSGEARQGRIGVGWATLAALRGTPAAEPTLTLQEADAALAAVAAAAGKGSAAARSATLRALFERATAAEQTSSFRLLVGELRQGALEGVMLDAVAAASGLPAADVRRAAMLTGHLGTVARVAMVEGASGLARFAVALHRPVQPMLATPADDIAGAMAQLGTAALEWKVDGARVQVHKAGGEVKVYTRALKDVTASAPEIVEALHALPAHELILDGEAVALAADGAPLPFQVTMRRFGRKLDIERMRAELPLAVYFFDCLHVDGTSLLDRPAGERFDALAAALPKALVIPRIVTADVAAAEDFYADALARGHEGVMAKALDAPYEAGRRGRQLAQGQARAHARPRRPRRRVGARPAPGMALEPAPRRARPGAGVFGDRLGDARQDVQGNDRRAPRLADEGAARARGPARQLRGVGEARARRRDRLQRSAGEPALPGPGGAALRARQGISARQDGGRRGHHRDRARASRGPARSCCRLGILPVNVVFRGADTVLSPLACRGAWSAFSKEARHAESASLHRQMGAHADDPRRRLHAGDELHAVDQGPRRRRRAGQPRRLQLLGSERRRRRRQQGRRQLGRLQQHLGH